MPWASIEIVIIDTLKGLYYQQVKGYALGFHRNHDHRYLKGAVPPAGKGLA
jgi:hypothetical protein